MGLSEALDLKKKRLKRGNVGKGLLGLENPGKEGRFPGTKSPVGTSQWVI